MEHLLTLGLAALFFVTVLGVVAFVVFLSAFHTIDNTAFKAATEDVKSLKAFLKGKVGKA